MLRFAASKGFLRALMNRKVMCLFDANFVGGADSSFAGVGCGGGDDDVDENAMQ